MPAVANVRYFRQPQCRQPHGAVRATVSEWEGLLNSEFDAQTLRKARRPTVSVEVDPEELLVVLTASLDDGGRKAAIAFGVALAALSNGANVHLFLSLEAAVLGTPTGAAGLRPRGFSEALADYIGHFVELGGKLEVCSSCYEEYCRELPKDGNGRAELRPNTAIHSLGIVAERAGHMPIVAF